MLKVFKNSIPSLVKKLLIRLRNMIFDQHAIKSYSQEGEDIVLQRIFSQQKTGFYVDVGAHHPMRFSNTYNFYKQGWRGINIEPNPDSFNLFGKYRPKDINVNCGVAIEKSSLNYYMFDEPALNTFDSEVLKSRIADTPYNHMKTVRIVVAPLAEILKLNTPKDRKIDFLTVDVEGFDLEVLKSNDWVSYRPSWVLVEQLNLGDIESLNFEIHDYMKSLNYVLFAKTFNTLFYKDKAVL
jgi:FkbM family methyltransferase